MGFCQITIGTHGGFGCVLEPRRIDRRGRAPARNRRDAAPSRGAGESLFRNRTLLRRFRPFRRESCLPDPRHRHRRGRCEARLARRPGRDPAARLFDSDLGELPRLLRQARIERDGFLNLVDRLGRCVLKWNRVFHTGTRSRGRTVRVEAPFQYFRGLRGLPGILQRAAPGLAIALTESGRSRTACS